MEKGREDEAVDEKAMNHRETKRGEGGSGGGGPKGKSCKGYLYYSSTLKSNGANPRCIGIPRKLPQVPNSIIGQSEAEASKEGRILADFYYACAGYSVFVTKDHSSDEQATKTELPVCVGLELLVDRRTAGSGSASAHNREDGRGLPHTQTNKPAHSAGDEFLNRFTRNASLVASGVYVNMRRVGNYIKVSLEDIIYPNRRRPK